MKNTLFTVVEKYHNLAPAAPPSIVGAKADFAYGFGSNFEVYVKNSIGAGKLGITLQDNHTGQTLTFTATADRARELEDFFRLVRTHLDAGGK